MARSRHKQGRIVRTFLGTRLAVAIALSVCSGCSLLRVQIPAPSGDESPPDRKAVESEPAIVRGIPEKIDEPPVRPVAVNVSVPRTDSSSDLPVRSGDFARSDASGETGMTAGPPGADNPSKVRWIIDRSKAFYREYDKYTCRVIRQERVKSKLQASETMVMHFRREPRSVRYCWLDAHHKGREVVFVEGRNDGKIITLGGPSDLFFANRRLTVDPDGFFVKGKSRRSITESGMDKLVGRLEVAFDEACRAGSSSGEIRYAGLAPLEEGTEPVFYHVLRQIPPAVDPMYPIGATQEWHFVPGSARVARVRAVDTKDRLLEHYAFDRFVPNPSLDDADFDPDLLWTHCESAD